MVLLLLFLVLLRELLELLMVDDQLLPHLLVLKQHLPREAGAESHFCVLDR